jgi:hypothetical protein
MLNDSPTSAQHAGSRNDVLDYFEDLLSKADEDSHCSPITSRTALLPLAFSGNGSGVE